MMSLFMLTGISLEGHCQNSETGDSTSASAKGTNVLSACFASVQLSSNGLVTVILSGAELNSCNRLGDGPA
jgi:hypothetical protein